MIRDLNIVCVSICPFGQIMDSIGRGSQTMERWIRNHPQILSSFAFVLLCRRGRSYPKGTVESFFVEDHGRGRYEAIWIRYHWVGVIIWSCRPQCRRALLQQTDRYSLLSQWLTMKIHMIHDKYVYMRNMTTVYTISWSFIHFLGWFPGSPLEQAKALRFLSLPWARSCSGLSLLSLEHPWASLKSAAIQ